jgi:hypothetical protein
MSPPSRILYATCRGDRRFVDGVAVDTLSLTDAVAAAGPGDTVQLLPGAFFTPTDIDAEDPNVALPKPIVLRDVAGTAEAPVVIRGLGARTSLRGEGKAEVAEARLPTADQFAFFKLFNCEWIVFENFDVAACWPTFLYLENSRYVTARNITATDGRYLIFARGEASHHLLVEGIHWRQDPTGSVWRDIAWESVKREDNLGYYYYNGGLFGAVDISGSVVIRRNTLCQTFNGLRLKANAKKADRLNHNVEVYGNRFHDIRDNPVEPERTAVNWHVHDNVIVNAHAWFSLDAVGGGFWYFCGNKGYFNDRQGQPEGDNTGGAVYKFDEEGSMPDRPVLAAFNSFFLRSNLIKEGRTKHFNHLDNVVVFCTPRDLAGYDPDPPCPFPTGCPDPCAPSPPLADPESFGCVAPDAPGRSFVAAPNFLNDPAGDALRFDGDLTNRPFPEAFGPAGFETAGRSDPGVRFVAPFDGDLRLAGPDLAGGPVVLRAGLDWPGDYDWRPPSGAVAGAMQPHGARPPVPPFVFCPPANPAPGYDEAPRPVALSFEDDSLVVHFSRPLAAGTVTAVVEDRHGRRQVSGRTQGTRLFLDVARTPLHEAVMVALPADLAGVDGKKISLFAADDRVKLL